MNVGPEERVEGRRKRSGRLAAWLFLPVLLASAWLAWRPAGRFPLPIGAEFGWNESNAVAAMEMAAQLILLLLPWIVAALAWRWLPRAMRIAAVALLVPFTALTARDTGRRVEAEMDIAARFFATVPGEPMLRQSPERAARRALAAGDHAFLGVAGETVAVPGVENGCIVTGTGLKVIAGTSDFFTAPGHPRFMRKAERFARRYNAEVAKRLRLDRDELARAVEPSACPGSPAAEPPMRLWTGGALVLSRDGRSIASRRPVSSPSFVE
ncbi:MAG TPA: hypothetical protein VFR81_22850 [Longimicrobium sp.]|nr:hypothetical protein [Longimicrobium sp.]